MLSWLRLACSFDDDIFLGDATLLGCTNPPPTGKILRMNLPALKSWSRDDVNVSFIANGLILFDSNKQYLAAVANVRILEHISGELHTGIDYKDPKKNILKSLIMVNRGEPTWWDAKSEKSRGTASAKLEMSYIKGLTIKKQKYLLSIQIISIEGPPLHYTLTMV
jgi:hypothetical protein